MSSRPKLLILGYGRHGKDTFAEILSADHGYTFQSSSHFLAQAVVRPEMAKRGIEYGSLEECYNDRSNHRALWYEIIWQYNKDDRARLAREILKVADCYVGMRSAEEYAAARKLFDLVIWVDASRRGIPPEAGGSMTIEPSRAGMYWVDNGGTLSDLKEQAASLVRALSWRRDIPRAE